MNYVDFFCLPLKPENESKYLKSAKIFAEVMKEHGLINYCEAIADNVPKGEVTDFYKAVKAEGNETVVAAYCIWPDKATRDKAWEEGMKDPRMTDMNPADMAFDGKRLFWGGFRSIFEV